MLDHVPFINSSVEMFLNRLFICALCCLFCGMAHAQFEDVKKGDIIEINGTKAIVFRVDGNGHGSAMSINALRGREDAWATKKKDANNIPAYSETDGMANTQAVYDYARSNGISLSNFPAFEWCNSLGPSWYIPSIKQMEMFVNYILGNEQEYDWDSEDEMEMDVESLTTKEINERILDAGGVPFIANTISGGWTMGVYTSTKNSDNKVYVYTMNPKKNMWSFKKMSISSIGKFMMGRAFIDF